MNARSRLHPETLSALPADVARPGDARASVRCGVVHLGIGAFHRAHQAVYFDEAVQRGDLRWGVVGVSLRSPQVRNELAPQDGLYSLIVCEAGGERLRVICAVREVLVAPENPAAVVTRMAQWPPRPPDQGGWGGSPQRAGWRRRTMSSWR